MNTPQANFIITYHVETGCLGAEGQNHLSSFCQFLTTQLNKTHGKLCTWRTQALIDIHNSHFQYSVQNKKLTTQQAKIYLNALNTDIHSFENNIDECVVNMIDEYFGR